MPAFIQIAQARELLEIPHPDRPQGSILGFRYDHHSKIPDREKQCTTITYTQTQIEVLGRIYHLPRPKGWI